MWFNFFSIWSLSFNYFLRVLGVNYLFQKDFSIQTHITNKTDWQILLNKKCVIIKRHEWSESRFRLIIGGDMFSINRVCRGVLPTFDLMRDWIWFFISIFAQQYIFPSRSAFRQLAWKSVGLKNGLEFIFGSDCFNLLGPIIIIFHMVVWAKFVA